MTLPILELTVEQRCEIFNQVSIEQNIPVQAAEKEDADGKIIQDQDPTEVNISYTSLFEANPYLKAQVKIEVSARSMHDPVDTRTITSFVDAFYHDRPFALPPFEVLSVRPTRTFLEKAILLHEGFEKGFSPEKAERKSRHLYDLVQLMDTEHGQSATADTELFNAIVAHRVRFTREKGVDYEKLNRKTITFIPPAETHEFWENDYTAMIESMIQGAALTFPQLMERLAVLQERFREEKEAE